MLNNVLLVIDVRDAAATDLSVIRSLPALAGIGLLLYGFIWDADG